MPKKESEIKEGWFRVIIAIISFIIFLGIIFYFSKNLKFSLFYAILGALVVAGILIGRIQVGYKSPPQNP